MRRAYIILIGLIIFIMIPYESSVEAASKKVSLTISKGVAYYGEVLNGKPHGKGSMKWGENKTYSGDWVNGKRSGYGKFSNYQINDDEYGQDYSSSEVYEGKWSNDLKDGEGKFKRTLFQKSDFEMPSIFIVKKGTFKKGEFIKGFTSEEHDNQSSLLHYEEPKIDIYIELTGANTNFWHDWKNNFSNDLNNYQKFDYITYNYWTYGKGEDTTYKGVSVERYYDINSMVYLSGIFGSSDSFKEVSEITLDLFQNPDKSYITTFTKYKDDQEVNSISNNSFNDPILNKYKTELLPMIKPYVSGFISILSEKTPFIERN
ncbi:hypothetical protein [Paenibacillus sp. BAC0078]